MSDKEKKDKSKGGFDIVKLLSFVSKPEQKFSPKLSKKMWDDAEIVMLGALVKHLKTRGVENKELKQTINSRLDDFEKARKQKDYHSSEVNPITQERVELDKIKKARDEINISRLSKMKKLSSKTKNLLKNALNKALKEKEKKNEIIVGRDKEKKKSTDKNQSEISKEEKKRVDDMINVAVDSGAIDKSDLEMH